MRRIKELQVKLRDAESEIRDLTKYKGLYEKGLKIIQEKTLSQRRICMALTGNQYFDEEKDLERFAEEVVRRARFADDLEAKVATLQKRLDNPEIFIGANDDGSVQGEVKYSTEKLVVLTDGSIHSLGKFYAYDFLNYNDLEGGE